MNLYALLNHLPAAPEAVLLVGACVLMIADTFVKDERRALTYWIAQGTLGLCLAATLFVVAFTEARQDGNQVYFAKYYIFNGLFVADFLSHVVKLVFYAAVSATLVYSRQWLLDRGLLRGEFFSLLLFSLLGMMLLASANSFLTVFLGLELMSLCLYALVALNRDSALATEAAMKYFVLGALSSGLLLYGMSMIYGATGTLAIPEVAASVGALAARDHNFLVFGLVFVVAG
ncbi:MAG TPA: proton-conducting transporter membrane subunit, partial [Burkholderiales bacterium]